jgi:hypothetical protein
LSVESYIGIAANDENRKYYNSGNRPVYSTEPPWAKHVGCGEAKTTDSPDGSYQPTLSLSGAKWQLDGRQAAGVTACCVGWHDCCLPAGERSGWYWLRTCLLVRRMNEQQPSDIKLKRPENEQAG